MSLSGTPFLISRPLVTLAVVSGMLATSGLLLSPAVLFDESREGFGVLSKAEDDSLGVIETASGPLSPADRDFLRQIRRAGLWEGPSGLMAQARSRSAAVKEAGKHLIEGHKALDNAVVNTARSLNVRLPEAPNDQQKGFIEQMKAAPARQFDATFVNLTRRAHGKVLPLVAQTRSNTQNRLVRQLADQANSTVLDHISVLERTRMVDFSALAR